MEEALPQPRQPSQARYCCQKGESNLGNFGLAWLAKYFKVHSGVILIVDTIGHMLNNK